MLACMQQRNVHAHCYVHAVCACVPEQPALCMLRGALLRPAGLGLVAHSTTSPPPTRDRGPQCHPGVLPGHLPKCVKRFFATCSRAWWGQRGHQQQEGGHPRVPCSQLGAGGGLTWHSHLSFCSFWKASVLVSTVEV